MSVLVAAPVTKKQLVGRWHNGMDMGRETIEFSASGKFRLTYSEGEGGSEKGKWNLNKGTVKITKANGKVMGNYALMDTADPDSEGKTILRKTGAANCQDGVAACWFKEN